MKAYHPPPTRSKPWGLLFKALALAIGVGCISVGIAEGFRLYRAPMGFALTGTLFILFPAWYDKSPAAVNMNTEGCVAGTGWVALLIGLALTVLIALD
jgi:hypothetical protein